MPKIVVVDSDSIFALYNPNDPLNSQATLIFQELINQNFNLVYPTSVIFEVISLFQRVLPTPKITQKIIEMVKKDEILIQIIDAGILREAASLFDPSGSKKNTLVDYSVIAVAKKINAEGVFSFDNLYTKHNIKLAKDLVKIT